MIREMAPPRRSFLFIQIERMHNCDQTVLWQSECFFIGSCQSSVFKRSEGSLQDRIRSINTPHESDREWEKDRMVQEQLAPPLARPTLLPHHQIFQAPHLSL